VLLGGGEVCLFEEATKESNRLLILRRGEGLIVAGLALEIAVKEGGGVGRGL